VVARVRLRKVVAIEALEAITEEFVYDCPAFAKELISLFLRFPLMGTCTNIYCNSEGLVPVEPLGCRCPKCGKGKATDETTLANGLEGWKLNLIVVTKPWRLKRMLKVVGSHGINV
jgi:predicted CxxxxCH...CXXCH cytochrome family protein